MFTAAQSFYIDPNSVEKSPVVLLTSVDLYFKQKPSISTNASGTVKPGVHIAICPILDGIPRVDQHYPSSITRIEYDNINTSSTAASLTSISFAAPLQLQTDKEYAILIGADGEDPGFILWKNSTGEVDVISGATAKVSSGKVDGNYFDITNGTNITPQHGVDLKFTVKVAKFSGALSATFKATNQAYEFIKLATSTTSGTFIGGEYVYQAQANLVGTVTVVSGSSNVGGTTTDFVTDIANNDLIVVANSTVTQVRKVNVVGNSTFLNVTSSFATSMTGVNIRSFESGTLTVDTTSNTIVGTNTSFVSTSALAAGQYIIITDGTDGNTEVRKIVSVANNTSLVLDVRPSFSNTQAAWFVSPTGKVNNYKSHADGLILYNSSANSTAYFSAGKIVKGVDSLATSTISEIQNIPLSRFESRYSTAQPTGSKLKLYANFANSTYATSAANKREITNAGGGTVIDYPGIIASRSNEVLNSTNLFANAHSMSVELVATTENAFTSPVINESLLDFDIQQFIINNDSTNEAYANGAADSKYISKPVVLGVDQIAEDLIVYVEAYRPSGTDVEVYTKLLSEEDNEAFSKKNWTKMKEVILAGSSSYSLNAVDSDTVIIKYVLPPYQPTTTPVTTGTFSVQSANAIVTASHSTVNTDIVAGDLVLIKKPTVPDTYLVDLVVASNTTTFTLSQTTANADIIGSGLKVEVIDPTNSAFLNNQNYNIVRYFNTTNGKYDGFKQFAIKIVMKSADYHNAPRIESYRAIAVSA